MAAPEPPQSRLLALPRELRDEIYTLAFESTEVDLAWKGTKHRNGGVMLACKQTYEEAIDLYYKHTPFLTYTEKYFRDALERRPKRHLANISELRISMDASDFSSNRDFLEAQNAVIRMWLVVLRPQSSRLREKGVVKCRAGLGPVQFQTWVSWPIAKV